MRTSVYIMVAILLSFGCKNRAAVKEYNHGLNVSVRTHDCGPHKMDSGLRCSSVTRRFISHKEIKKPLSTTVSVEGVANITWQNDTDQPL